MRVEGVVPLRSGDWKGPFGRQEAFQSMLQMHDSMAQGVSLRLLFKPGSGGCSGTAIAKQGRVMSAWSQLRSVYRRLVPVEARRRLYKLRNPAHFRKLRRAVYRSPRGDFSLRPFDEHRCIFIHIPKTAGISVAESLFGYLPYHYTAADYKLIYGRRTFRRYFKFAFVRNPWDRLFSAYRFLMAGGWNESDRQWRNENIARFSDFSEFVTRWLSPETALTMMHLRPQWRFVCNRRRELELDYLGYLETIDDDFGVICARLGIRASLQHRNASAKADYREHYSVAARQVVEDVYRDDIALFGYRFDGIGHRQVLGPGHIQTVAAR